MSFISTLSIAPGQPVAAVAAALRAALGSAKVVHLRGLAAGRPAAEWPAFYDALTEATGQCLHLDENFAQGSIRTGQKWIQVRYDAAIPDDAAYRFSKNAQPLHTDESYLSEPAEVMFMHCLVQAPAGGETTFVDADVLWAQLQRHAPALAARLLDHPVRFAKADDARTLPIVARTPGGLRLNWNYHCVDPTETAEPRPGARVSVVFADARYEHARRSRYSVGARRGRGLVGRPGAARSPGVSGGSYQRPVFAQKWLPARGRCMSSPSGRST